MRALVNFCSEKVQFIVVNEISFDVNAKFRRSTYICIRMEVGTRAQMRLTFSSRNRTIDSRVCTVAFFANLSILNSIYRLNGLIGQFLFWLMLHWLKCHYESVIIANIMSHHSWNVTIISVCSLLQQKFAISRQSGFCKLLVILQHCFQCFLRCKIHVTAPSPTNFFLLVYRVCFVLSSKCWLLSESLRLAIIPSIEGFLQ